MASENMEIARSYYAALTRTLDAYAVKGGPIEEAPFIDDFFAWAHPEIEWDWVFTPEVFRGREELLRAGSDFLSAVEGWRVDAEEFIDAGEHVLVVIHVRGIGRTSGAPVHQVLFTVLGFRDGKVAHVKDHVDRAAALEAAGVPAS